MRSRSLCLDVRIRVGGGEGGVCLLMQRPYASFSLQKTTRALNNGNKKRSPAKGNSPPLPHPLSLLLSLVYPRCLAPQEGKQKVKSKKVTTKELDCYCLSTAVGLNNLDDLCREGLTHGWISGLRVHTHNWLRTAGPDKGSRRLAP